METIEQTPTITLETEKEYIEDPNRKVGKTILSKAMEEDRAENSCIVLGGERD